MHLQNLRENPESFICKGRSRRLATEIRTSKSICHGLTRNFTEKTEAEDLPRINTENTEISRIRINHGRKTHLSEPDA